MRFVLKKWKKYYFYFCFRVSVSRRTFGPGNVNVHAWFGATQQLTKCIWLMAVAQHQFYHDRKHSRVRKHLFFCIACAPGVSSHFVYFPFRLLPLRLLMFSKLKHLFDINRRLFSWKII